MTVNRWFVAVAALTAAIAPSITGAATALATPTTAGPFELTLEYQVPWWEGGPNSPEGTFAARAPFCRSGTSIALPTRVGAAEARHRLTCDDGSGSLVVSASIGLGEHEVDRHPIIHGSFRILEGTGSYASLRGKGSQSSEILTEYLDPDWYLDPDCVSDVVGDFLCPAIVIWRSTLEGVAAEDAVAPTIAISSVDVTKLPRPAGAYSLALAIALGDEVEGNPVSYQLRVTPTTSARELAGNVGTAQAGTVSMTMPVRYYRPRVRAVLLRLTASDEVGNESSISQVVKLPR